MVYPLKIAYLHGLNGNNINPKNQWLRQIADEVYDPIIKYGEKDVYNALKADLLKFKPDFIAGSSMGGLYAFYLGRELNIPMLLFNPALHSYNLDYASDLPEINDLPAEKLCVVLGRYDSLINPMVTIEKLKQHNIVVENDTCIMLNHNHHTPVETFIEQTLCFIQKNISRV